MLGRLFDIVDENDIQIVYSLEVCSPALRRHCGYQEILNQNTMLGFFLHRDNDLNHLDYPLIYINRDAIHKSYSKYEAELEILLHEMCHWYYYERFFKDKVYEYTFREEAEVLSACLQMGSPITMSGNKWDSFISRQNPDMDRVNAMVRYFKRVLNA